jgi:glycerol-3-phosphate acyltransferase PlsX
MGGDRGPAEIIAGAVDAATERIAPVIFGPAGLDTNGLEHVVASDVIEMDDNPVDAVRAKPNSSMVSACRSVGEGRCDAVVSAGSTGAMLAAGFRVIGRLPGVMRPAIGVVLPALSGPAVLIDSGANADARPEHLLQFALMGSIFAEEVLGVVRPEVRLLSIGEEAEKGNQLTLEAHALLAASDLPFRGNVESRELLRDPGHVIVCDGFTGNVALKAIEGTIRTMFGSLTDEIKKTPTGTLGGLLIRPGARRLRARLDPDNHGGAYLLGLKGLVVIAHGNSSRRAISNAVKLAARGVEKDVVARLGARLPERTPAGGVREA